MATAAHESREIEKCVGEARIPTSLDVDRRWQRFFASCGFIFAVIVAAGLEGFWPQPPRFDLSASQTAQYYVMHQTGFWIGNTMISIGMAFLLAWTVQLGLMLWRLEGGSHAMAAVALVSLVASPILLSFDLAIFSVAAFRPAETSPDVTRALSDIAWIGSELIWPMLAAGMALAGILILKTQGSTGAFPRYLGWFSLFDAMVEMFQIPIIFVKSGPFAADGLFAWYATVSTWGVWAIGLSFAMYRILGQDTPRSERSRARMRVGAKGIARTPPSG